MQFTIMGEMESGQWPIRKLTVIWLFLKPDQKLGAASGVLWLWLKLKFNISRGKIEQIRKEFYRDLLKMKRTNEMYALI